jgi:hypothetical protein
VEQTTGAVHASPREKWERFDHFMLISMPV